MWGSHFKVGLWNTSGPAMLCNKITYALTKILINMEWLSVIMVKLKGYKLLIICRAWSTSPSRCPLRSSPCRTRCPSTSCPKAPSSTVTLLSSLTSSLAPTSSDSWTSSSTRPRLSPTKFTEGKMWNVVPYHLMENINREHSLSCFACVEIDRYLQVWSNPNQSNRWSAVQWYFPLRNKWVFSDITIEICFKRGCYGAVSLLHGGKHFLLTKCLWNQFNSWN